MELKFDPSVNRAHKKWEEEETKRVHAIKKAQIEQDEKDYYANRTAKRVAVTALVAAGMAVLLIGGKLIDNKLTDKVYKVYGSPTGVTMHPETHEQQKYWTIDGKNYFIGELKFRAIFEGSKDNSKTDSSYTFSDDDLIGPANTSKGGK